MFNHESRLTQIYILQNYKRNFACPVLFSVGLIESFKSAQSISFSYWLQWLMGETERLFITDSSKRRNGELMYKDEIVDDRALNVKLLKHLHGNVEQSTLWISIYWHALTITKICTFWI